MRAAHLDVAQVYGGDLPNVPRVWRALGGPVCRPGHGESVEAILLDGPANGITFDWNQARGAAEKLILAGGLNASNVAEAIRVAQPWGVDASSGLESAPGIKGSRKSSAVCKGGSGSTMITSQVTSQPDATGHFGPYGGRFVPEVLMAPLEELEQAYRAASADPSFQAELDRSSHALRRPPHASVLRPPAQRNSGRREDLSQARRPAPHRRAQDQQLPGPGPARPPHGQEAHHRRDRRGAARRRHGHRVRAVRPRMHRLHGRRGHAPPAPERLPHAAPGRQRGRASPTAAARSRTPSAKPCATGSPTSTPRTICSARRSARIPIR